MLFALTTPHSPSQPLSFPLFLSPTLFIYCLSVSMSPSSSSSFAQTNRPVALVNAAERRRFCQQARPLLGGSGGSDNVYSWCSIVFGDVLHGHSSMTGLELSEHAMFESELTCALSHMVTWSVVVRRQFASRLTLVYVCLLLYPCPSFSYRSLLKPSPLPLSPVPEIHQHVAGSLSKQATNKHTIRLSPPLPLPVCLGPSISAAPLGRDHLVGLVVKASASRASAGIFSGSSHTSDIGTPVATLPGAWRYRVSTGTGRPGVSIL